MTTYPWYCPDCGREDYGFSEEDTEPKRCTSCGADLCKLEPEGEEKPDSEDKE